MRKFNLNRVGKYARYAYFAMASATLLAIPCFASTGVAEIDTPINNLLTMFFGLLKVVGIFVGLFGLVQIVMAGFSHDSTKRIIGVTCIIGGFIPLLCTADSDVPRYDNSIKGSELLCMNLCCNF